MTLVDVVQEMVLKSAIGAQGVAERIGKKYRVLLGELNSESENFKLGADLLIPLMSTCKDVSPLHYMAKAMGGVFIKLSEAHPGDRTIMKVITEFGDLVREYSKAIEDGKITDAERASIEKEAYEAIAAIQALICSLDS